MQSLLTSLAGPLCWGECPRCGLVLGHYILHDSVSQAVTTPGKGVRNLTGDVQKVGGKKEEKTAAVAARAITGVSAECRRTEGQ